MNTELDEITADTSAIILRLATLRHTASEDDATIIATAENHLKSAQQTLWPLRSRGEPAPVVEPPPLDPAIIAAEEARQAAEAARQEAQAAATREQVEAYLAKAFDGIDYRITINEADTGSLLLRSKFDHWRIEGERWDLLAQVANLSPVAITIEVDGVDHNFRNVKTRAKLSPTLFVGAIRQAMESRT